MEKLLLHVEQTIRVRRIFRSGERMLVAVSGGVDSMVLLQLLHTLALKFHWKLAVAHFNHQLRGRSSDADERLVRTAAKELQLPFLTERGEVKAHAGRTGQSIEMAARELRHEFLTRSPRRLKCGCIALAHHQGDQVELFFLRLLRGSGGEG